MYTHTHNCIYQFLGGQTFLVMNCQRGVLIKAISEPKHLKKVQRQQTCVCWSSLLFSYLSLVLFQDLKMARGRNIIKGQRKSIFGKAI